MRNMLIGFVVGLLVGATVWAAGPLSPQDPGIRSRPDRLWEQDRGSSLKEWMQQREQDTLFQQQRHNLMEEVDRLKRRPC